MQDKIGKLILVRHAESEWNKEHLFTGKKDVHLTGAGFEQSEMLGALISDIAIDRVFTSTQARSIETEVCMMSRARHCTQETIRFSSDLNERDYGDYTGLNKVEEEAKIGHAEMEEIRRGWDVPVPHGETLKMVYGRAVPFFRAEILPVLNNGENVLIVSHGNTIRALMKYIEKISDEDIAHVEMPFKEVFIYEVDREGYALNKEIRRLNLGKVERVPLREKAKTQIIATIGPASEKVEVLDEMIKAGMDVARLNFFWPGPAESIERIKNIRQLAKMNQARVLVLADLPGPRLQDKDGHTYDVGSTSAITDRDRELIKFSVENDLDYISVSFVGNAEDVLICKSEIQKYNGRQKVVAKIERREAVKNLDAILEVADAIMIARGDLGNEVPLETIPFIQDEIIKKCNALSKPVITATQMLYSMKDSPSPTRAELTDVVHAIVSGSDAVMLSEETSVGKYPIRAVYVMDHLAKEAEAHAGDRKFNYL